MRELALVALAAAVIAACAPREIPVTLRNLGPAPVACDLTTDAHGAVITCYCDDAPPR